ncbi:zinc finger protein GLIS3 [Danio rerio]|uniref:GLIS family zinc finger 3 n=1 Tax=Danio rerio TaxID=7955 RepID=F1QB13_DANRE|nr:zinc finger protein GLIS3 [Danio rerio]|eukprot:NP_001074076.2 zinc finger protein GLIS3 [Danio rerio]
MDMNGKGCNLMVSPSGMAQISPLKVHTPASLYPESNSAQSLRRQVLTNGKLGFPQPSRALHQQAPQISLPASSSSKQSARQCCQDSGMKGYRRVFGSCGSSNLQVSSSAFLVQSLSPASASVTHSSSQTCPQNTLTLPFNDASRCLLSRESLASTTLSLAETQSVRSSKLDWPYGYRVLPPLGHQTANQLSESTVPESSLSESVSNPASLPHYLFKEDGSSPRLSARSKKRALSLSPLSDGLGLDLNSIIRTSPTSLVAYIIGSRISPASHNTPSPLQADVCGHLLGIRGSGIPTSSKHSISVSESLRMQPLEDQFTNLLVEQQILPDPQTAKASQTHTLQFEVSRIVRSPSPPRGPPPPYSAHHQQQQQPRVLQLQRPAGLQPMLEEEEEEEESCGGTHCCCWLHCGAIYSHRDALVKHIEKIHVDQRKGEDFTCFWAGCARKHKPFNARYKLLIHMRVHSGEKPNKCSFEGCQKAFSRLENLKIHLRSHTGEKPYVCPHPGCLKAFSNSSDRAKHQRTHVDTKPYACQIQGCGKRYTDPSSLRKHVKSHSLKEQQARKKLRRSSDLSQDGLSECLTVQPLQHSLSTLDLIESKHHSPTDDLYTVFTLNQPSQTNTLNSPMQIAGGPQTHQSPHQTHQAHQIHQTQTHLTHQTHQAHQTQTHHIQQIHQTHLTHQIQQIHQTHLSPHGALPPLQGNNRFLSPNSHKAPGFCSQPRTSAQDGFSAVFSYADSDKHISSCSVMQTPMFEDNLSSSPQIHSNISVLDCQSGPQGFIGEQEPSVSEDNYLHIPRCPSRISCVFTEG